MSMPVFVIGAGPVCVEDAEGTSKDPQRPTGMQAVYDVQSVAEPGIDDIGSRVFVATQFAKVSGDSVLRHFAPGTELSLQCVLVGNRIDCFYGRRDSGHAGKSHGTRACRREAGYRPKRCSTRNIPFSSR